MAGAGRSAGGRRQGLAVGLEIEIETERFLTLVHSMNACNVGDEVRLKSQDAVGDRCLKPLIQLPLLHEMQVGGRCLKLLIQLPLLSRVHQQRVGTEA